MTTSDHHDDPTVPEPVEPDGPVELDVSVEPAGSVDPTGPADTSGTPEYLDLIRSVHAEWTAMDASGEEAAGLSAASLTTVKQSVRADARHGAQVDMPATPRGPWTMTELALRTLLRRAVDAVPGVSSLRFAVEYDDGDGARTRGLPLRIRSRITVAERTPDLIAVADRVRGAILAACREQFALRDPVVDVHIEDLHA